MNKIYIKNQEDKKTKKKTGRQENDKKGWIMTQKKIFSKVVKTTFNANIGVITAII